MTSWSTQQRKKSTSNTFIKSWNDWRITSSTARWKNAILLPLLSNIWDISCLTDKSQSIPTRWRLLQTGKYRSRTSRKFRAFWDLLDIIANSFHTSVTSHDISTNSHERISNSNGSNSTRKLSTPSKTPSSHLIAWQFSIPRCQRSWQLNACDYALGAVLMQQFPQGERPIAFISRTLNNTEQNYSMWEKELFAVVWAIKYFRPYLLNYNFLVKSDNKPSTQLLVNSALKLSTSATNRVIRWILSIQGYSFKVEHQAGKTNVVADALSRFAAHINAMPDDYETAQFCQTQSAPVTNTEISRLFQEAYKQNPACSAILKQQQDGQYHPRLALHEQLIVTREIPFRVMIPDNTALRSALFQEIHDTPLAGHPGFHKFMSYIRRHFVGPHLRRDVLDFARTCPQCQIAKPRHNLPFGTIMPLQPPEEPWQDISMDLIVHLPHSQIYNAIFVVVDRFSKMAHFIPTQTQISAPELAQIFLDNIVRLHGFPRKHRIWSRYTLLVTLLAWAFLAHWYYATLLNSKPSSNRWSDRAYQSHTRTVLTYSRSTQSHDVVKILDDGRDRLQQSHTLRDRNVTVLSRLSTTRKLSTRLRVCRSRIKERSCWSLAQFTSESSDNGTW